MADLEASVVSVSGPGRGKSVILKVGQPVKIGRAAGMDFKLEDPSVSRFHAEVRFDGRALKLLDAGSSHGVFVNGKRVTEAALGNGGCFMVGDTEIMVRIQAPERLPEIAGYQITGKIGQGGMGSVYVGLQESTGRQVAVKVMKYAADPDPALIAMFNREAMALGVLKHKNVVEIIEVGASGGSNFIVMEYVPGQTVGKLLKERGRLGLVESLQIAVAVAEVLVEAENRGIVHRDIKPENIIVSPEGGAKVCDFGLAKEFEKAGLSGLTAAGAMMGTIHYMSPEQITDAREAGPKSDQYSLGATLYHMLAGKPRLFSTKVREEISRVCSSEADPLGAHVPELPRDLEFVVMKMIARDQAVRFDSAARFRDMLFAILEREKSKKQ